MDIIHSKPITQNKFLKIKESLHRRLEMNSIIFYDKEMNLEDNKRAWEKNFNYLEFQESKPIKIIS